MTISLASAEAMAKATRETRGYALLKVKLGGGRDDIARMRAVAANAGRAQLIMDANEAWHPDDLQDLMGEAAQLGVALIEQPLPAGDDAVLSRVDRPVPICADESAHVTTDLDALRDRYDAVNIKLDKAGGLTEALAMHARARELSFQIMIGCMVGSSLAMAPAMLLAQDAEFVDLDGPLLLAADCDHGLRFEAGMIHPPEAALWG